MEHGQQLPHHVKLDAAQNTVVGEVFQFPDAGTQGGILCIQFLDALFQVDSSGAVAEVSQRIDQCIDLPLRLGLLFAQGGKLGLKLGAVACVGGLCFFQLLHKVTGMVGKVLDLLADGSIQQIAVGIPDIT